MEAQRIYMTTPKTHCPVLIHTNLPYKFKNNVQKQDSSSSSQSSNPEEDYHHDEGEKSSCGDTSYSSSNDSKSTETIGSGDDSIMLSFAQ